MNCALNLFRGLAALLPQLTLLYFVAGSRDWLGGFNQSGAGFTTLLVLVVAAPLLCLAWMIVEARYAFRHFRNRKVLALILGPLLAMVFLLEALTVDLYILSHARM